MPTASENLEIVVNMRGAKDAAAQGRQVAAALDAVGMSAGKVTVNTQAMGQQTKRSSNAFVSAIKQTVAYSAAIGTLTAIGGAFATGFKFDATMEQNTIAFKHFLGSTQAAKAELDTLYEVAAKTPFQFSDITTAARRFLAFGFSVKQANDELSLIGDAIAGMGGGGEEINRMVTVLSQINAAGFLHGQDLMQLEQLGIVSRVGIAKQLGINVEQFNKAMAASKITSEQAITAINNIIRTQFKGSADEQSKTLLGQLSTAKDYGAQAAGAFVQPLVDAAKSGILPRIVDNFKQIAVYMKAGNAEQFWAFAGEATKVVGALLLVRGAFILLAKAQALAALASASFEAGLIGNTIAAVALIPGIAGLSDAFIVLTGAFEGTWLAAIGPVGWVIIAIAAITALYVKWKAFHDVVDSTLKILLRLQDVMQSPLGHGKGAAPSVTSKGLGLLREQIDPFARVKSMFHDLGFMADGGTIPVGGAAVVGERGPELAQNTGSGTRITPMGAAPMAPRVLQPIAFHLNGRVFAEAMIEVGQTAAARS